MSATEGPFGDWARRPPATASGSLAHGLGIAVYVAEPGPEGEWLHVSPAIREILGVSPEQLIGDRDLWLTLLHPDDCDMLMGLEVELEVDTRHRAEYRVRRPDGRVVWLLDDAVVGRAADGRSVMDGYLVDVTVQRRAERMVSAQAEVVHALTGRTPLAEVLAGLPTSTVEASSAVACVVEVGGSGTRARLELRALRSDVDDVPPGGETVSTDATAETGEAVGRVTLHYAPGVQPPPADVELPGWAAGLVALAVARVEERERAEHGFAQLAATLESTVDGILVVDSGGRIVGHNSRFLEMWGVPVELMREGDDARVISFVLEQLADPAAFLESVRRLYDSPEETSSDELHFTDGRVFERYSRPQRIDGVPVGRVWSFRDVTENRRLQEALHEREASLERLVDQVRDYSIINLDPEGRVVSWNQGAARIKRYAENEILGRGLAVFFPPEDEGRACRLIQRAVADGSARDEGWCVRQGGQRFWASTLLTALRDEQGRLRGFGLVMQDSTERRTAELALERRARTLSVVGTIATAANSATSVGDALDTALVAVCELGGWDLARVLLVDDATGRLRRHAWHLGTDVARGRFAELIAAVDAEPADEAPVPSAVMEKGRTIWVADLPDDGSASAEAAARAGVVSASGVPVLIGSEPVGVLEFFGTSRHPFDTEAEVVMRQLGAQLGRVVERQRAERRSAALALQVARLTSGGAGTASAPAGAGEPSGWSASS